MRIEEKEYTKSIDISIWKKVFPFLAPRKNVLIMVIVMNILCSVVDIIMPLFQRQAIDSFIEKSDRLSDVVRHLFHQRLHDT